MKTVCLCALALVVTAPIAAQEEPKSVGEMKREDILAELNRHLGPIGLCYERKLETTWNLGGKMSFEWTIELDGTVSNLTVPENTMGDSEIADCIVAVLGKMQFVQPEGGTMVVRYPFVFRPVSDSGSPPSVRTTQVASFLRQLAQEHLEEVKACYRAGLGRDGALSGKFKLRMTLTTSGTQENVRVDSEEMKDPEVTKCLVKAASGWALPKMEKATKVSIPFALVRSPAVARMRTTWRQRPRSENRREEDDDRVSVDCTL